MTIKDKTAIYRTGGGITTDSNPDEEYEETEHKAAMLVALSHENAGRNA